MPWIQTFSGKKFDLANPTPASIAIEDIAHALSHLCRYTGHVRRFYSVAQHSVLVSNLLPPSLQLLGLMHDATEAYVGDVSSPLKSMLPAYRMIEQNVWAAIAEKFSLPVELPDAVKTADLMALQAERAALLGQPPEAWGVDAVALPPIPAQAFPELQPEAAYSVFMRRWQYLASRPRVAA